jgi:hypothetical protein
MSKNDIKTKALKEGRYNPARRPTQKRKSKSKGSAVY